jgi:hypothetical protein
MMLRSSTISACIARPVAPRHKKEFSADESRDARRTRRWFGVTHKSRNAFDPWARVADMEQQAEPQFDRHLRVLHTSSCYLRLKTSFAILRPDGDGHVEGSAVQQRSQA